MATTSNIIKGGLAINEVGSNPIGAPGFDTDNSGSIDTFADEFIEIINTSGAPIDLTGVEIWEDQLVHSFAGGTLGAGEVLLILDNTANLAAAQAAYPGVTVVSASGSLSLANIGDGLAMVDTATGDYVALNYGNAVGGDTAASSPGFTGTNLIGTDNTALTPAGQSIQRAPGGDTNIVAANATPGVLCFSKGTRIATPYGSALVEDLSIGEPILTAQGHTTPVKWIGRQSVVTRLANARQEPIRIRAGALGDGLPHADLIVTADHGMILDGLVINASALVNGDTIDFVPMAELPGRVTYYHIETEAHDVILANGAPAETFVDYAGRQAFDNYQEYVDLYGAERIIPEMPALRISTQRLVPDVIRARLGIVEPEIDVALSLTA